jgi:hypothetical protein
VEQRSKDAPAAKNDSRARDYEIDTFVIAPDLEIITFVSANGSAQVIWFVTNRTRNEPHKAVTFRQRKG